MSLSPLASSQESLSIDNQSIEGAQAILALRSIQIHDVYARSAQIVQLHKTDNDYVAFHGQSTPLMIFGDLIKQMEILQNPEASYRHFKFFRVPSGERYESVQAFFDSHPFNEEADCPYDHFYSDKLLSIDLYKENEEPDESARDLFEFNRSILLEPDEDGEELELEATDIADHPKMIDITHRLLQSYNVPEAKKAIWVKQIQELIRDVEENNTISDLTGEIYRGVGNLYVMLLPKNLLDEEKHGFAYLCMEGSVRYDPAKQGLSRDQLLEGLQTDNIEVVQKFIGKDCTFFPQGRIICSALTPESGVRIFKLNALSSEFKTKYKIEIKRIAEEIFADSHSKFKKRERQTSILDDELCEDQEGPAKKAKVRQ